MIALMLTLCATPLAEGFEVPARELAWERLEERIFDRAWTLPERRREGRDLLAELQRLASLSAILPDGSVLTFGDLVAETSDLDGAARQAWFERLAVRAPKLSADWGAGLRELLLDGRLGTGEWKPSRDDEQDGILMADAWPLGAEYGAPWSDLDVVPLIEQGAILLRSDLASMKAVENDYRTYGEHVGAAYDEIFPVAGGHYRGIDELGRPFSSVALQFACDLPFPFGGYDCRLQILNRYAADGTARADIYSTSPDFCYLAGRDVFLPVKDSRGVQVAWLLVRHFGFDLDGVPDGSKHRAEALRSSLGNLKLKAEALAAQRDDAAKPTASLESLTHFRVLGER